MPCCDIRCLNTLRVLATCAPAVEVLLQKQLSPMNSSEYHKRGIPFFPLLLYFMSKASRTKHKNLILLEEMRVLRQVLRTWHQTLDLLELCVPSDMDEHKP